MPPLLSFAGEKLTLVLSQLVTAVKFVALGLAGSKAGIYGAEVVGCLAFLSSPTIMSIKANAVEEHEQGAVQGALSGVQALAQGLLPFIFMQIYRLCTTTVFLPRVSSIKLCCPCSFLRLGRVYLCGSCRACIVQALA